MTTQGPNLTEWRERAEFWASRDPDSGLYDRNAVAFADEVVQLLDQLAVVRQDREAWKGQVVAIRQQQNAALREAEMWRRRAERAEASVNEAHTYCARPVGVCFAEKGFNNDKPA